ncbi:MAG: AAA family ATPase [Lachnospiraceae bacterium]
MNIKRAKQEIENTIKAYLQKDEFGDYLIPAIRQRPVLLIGAPGIGKTQIMEQIAMECDIALVSYTITHHTRQSAIGLPFISKKTYGGEDFSVTEYTMSEIIASVYDQMERTGRCEGILFIDEINCVSETLAPTMLQFLQCKSFGNQKVPEGWIIVAAGNPPEYNKSVREFDVVTLDRVKKIEVEPDFSVWKEFARNAGVHGAIISYLELKKENFYQMETTVDGKRFATARGWQDLSELLKVYEKLGIPVDQEVIFQYIQHGKVAKDFANYLELYEKYRADYQIRGILQGRVKESAWEKLKFAPFDERLSVVGLLLSALSEEFEKAYDADQQTTLLFDALKNYRRCLRSPENRQLPEQLLCEMAEEKHKKSQADCKNGRIDRKRMHLEMYAAEMMEQYAKLLAQKTVADGETAFELVRTEFAKQTKLREQIIRETGEKLEYAFDFMERAFGESQEMVVFITELTIDVYGAKFLNENACGRYYKYNKGLLADERREGILGNIEEVEMLMKGHTEKTS